MQSRIGLVACAAALLLVERAANADASLTSRLGARIAKPIRAGGAGPARYRIQKYQPLLSEPHANCHAVALRADADTLKVIHRWGHSGEYDSAAVPWRDIVANQVHYSLSSMYGEARVQQAPAEVEDARCEKALTKPATSPAALPARCRRLSSDATLVGQGNELQLVARPNNFDRLNKTKTNQNQTEQVPVAARGVVWTLELPRGHELIDFSMYQGLLFIATRSNQGARDGEFLLPHDTTHVFAVAAPPAR